MLKGLAAGTVNLTLAFASGASLPEPGLALAGGVLGLFGYGISLVLFVSALRFIGTARTGAYYSVALFFGAVLAILLLGEAVTAQFFAASALMALGIWFHLTERHEHEHEHEPMTHSHRHVHDIHHQHAHGPDDPPGEPHTHKHTHIRLRHRHVHFPDIHHRHKHS